MYEIYDRMNPDWYQLMERLQDYSEKEPGSAAYPLSTAEAQLILDLMFDEGSVAEEPYYDG